MQLNMTAFTKAVIALILTSGILRSQPVQAWGNYFDKCSVKGSIVIYDLSSGKYSYYDSSRCCRQYTPASTFKIPNSIIGLETGVIADENFVIPWDGVKRSITEWNQDLDLKSAIKYSAVPYYQELARRVGETKMNEMVHLLGYGNMDISGGVDKFWLTGGMRISQVQQIEFLKKLYKNELPVSLRTMDITKKILLNEDTLGYKLFAKTGWGSEDSLNIGWWVGWVETITNVYFFALNIEAPDPVPNNFLNCRKSITREILKTMSVLPE